MNPSSRTFPDKIPTLDDGVVTLRGLRPEDSDQVVEQFSDPDVIRWMTVPQPFTKEHADARQQLSAQHWANGALYRFAVEVDGELAGGVNLQPTGPGVADIGYLLAASHRGRGLMSRALRLILQWGLDEAGIEVVHWRAQLGNWASRRAAWAVGFRVQETPVAGLLEHNGRPVDGWMATLRRGDRLEPAHPWLVPERITGRSVVLRPHGEPDVSRMVEACRDPDTAFWLSQLPAEYGEPQARQHLDQILAEQAAGKGVYWVVADPEDDRLLAEVGVFFSDLRDPQGEVGYWCHPDARGRGVTTEAVQLAVRHGLLPAAEGGLGLFRMLLRASDGNVASQRVAEKSGFTFGGRDRNAFRMRDGSRRDDLRFDLLATELPAVR